MLHKEPIRIALNSSESINSLGHSFAKNCLHPLITNNDRPRAITVALYGNSEMGKTTFYKGAMEFLGFSKHLLNGNILSNAGLKLYGKSVRGKSAVFRVRDFGYYVYADDWDVKSQYPLRGRPVGKSNFRPGLDLFEHAPLPYLKTANFVGLIRSPLEDSGDYFTNANGINSLSYKTVMNEEGFEGAKITSKEMQIMSDLFAELPLLYYKYDSETFIPDHKIRYLSIFPIMRDDGVLSAFNSFKTDLCSQGYYNTLEFSLSRPYMKKLAETSSLVNA